MKQEAIRQLFRWRRDNELDEVYLNEQGVFMEVPADHIDYDSEIIPKSPLKIGNRVNERNCFDPTGGKFRESLSKALWDKCHSDVVLQVQTTIDNYRQIYFSVSDLSNTDSTDKSLNGPSLLVNWSCYQLWELANEATTDWGKLLVKHKLDSVRMNEVTKINNHEVGL
ncbi:hypothetical protein DAPPUDRAFT_329171 [Daphnia pulex]|uniref:Uncharacterized protein n=1 Tax=Daphnia pulex TaxID=6669 RepID=E9HFV8_DAPPU|nr:hypothetical protein DAPPUDRAFT_329171 [Daphnia pulex]|eukprot:EFX69400.1 hypothetical protein DAPPUDRAFT_329171 [Daphnia pulex]